MSCRKLDGRLLHMRGPATVKLGSQKLCICGMRHVLSVPDHSWRRSLSPTSCMSSVKCAGASLPVTVVPGMRLCTQPVDDRKPVQLMQHSRHMVTSPLVAGVSKSQHITPVLHDVLHWLPVRQRILLIVAFWLCPRLARPTSDMSACLSLTSPVGRISVWLNVTTCWSLGPGLSSADGVSVLQLSRLELTSATSTSAFISHGHCTVQRWVQNPLLHTGLYMTSLRTYVEECINCNC